MQCQRRILYALLNFKSFADRVILFGQNNAIDINGHSQTLQFTVQTVQGSGEMGPRFGQGVQQALQTCSVRPSFQVDR
jgi:hypothetical protein